MPLYVLFCLKWHDRDKTHEHGRIGGGGGVWTPKIDRATRAFLKIDRATTAFLKIEAEQLLTL